MLLGRHFRLNLETIALTGTCLPEEPFGFAQGRLRDEGSL
jgi:hypothetical protein